MIRDQWRGRPVGRCLDYVQLCARHAEARRAAIRSLCVLDARVCANLTT
jgi:hypothetical protein